MLLDVRGADLKESGRHSLRLAVFSEVFDKLDGVTTTYNEFITYCSKRGIQLDFFAPSKKDTSAPHPYWTEKEGSVRIHRFFPKQAVSYYPDAFLDFNPGNRWRREQIVLERKPHIYVAVGPGLMGWEAMGFARRFNRPFVAVYHMSLPEVVKNILNHTGIPDEICKLIDGLVEQYDRLFHCNADLLLGITPQECTQLKETYGDSVHVRLSSGGVNTKRFHPRFREPHRRTNIIYVGRLAAEKNLCWLVQILREFQDCDVIIVGEGPLRSKLESLLPWAVYTGELCGEALSRVYASGDVFVLPSRVERCPLTVLEANASGVPAIVTDSGGSKELVVHGRTGFIARTDREFKDYLRHLIDNPELRRRMGKAARKNSENYHWDKIFDGLIEDCQGLVKLHPSHPKASPKSPLTALLSRSVEALMKRYSRRK